MPARSAPEPATPGTHLFAELSVPLLADPRVSTDVMFHSAGLRVGPAFFAFVGRDDVLIAKLPRARAQELLAEGVAGEVVLGRRHLREWVSFTNHPGTADLWATVLAEACAYVRTLPPPKRRGARPRV